MTNIVLASNNKKKIAELQTLLGAVSDGLVNVQSLRDIGFTDDIVEDGTTFEENSLIKAGTPARLGHIGIADDSGLAVDYLNGAPGIYSARYSGEGATDETNRAKLLRELDGMYRRTRSSGKQRIHDSRRMADFRRTVRKIRHSAGTRDGRAR